MDPSSDIFRAALRNKRLIEELQALEQQDKKTEQAEVRRRTRKAARKDSRKSRKRQRHNTNNNIEKDRRRKRKRE
tara:strand:- start:190 stop:414 length:225 start_codon:yes stop_codon:yes gene_type:complete